MLLRALTASRPACWLQKYSPVISQETFTWFNVTSGDGGSMEECLTLFLISCNQQVSVSHAMLCLMNPNLSAYL